MILGFAVSAMKRRDFITLLGGAVAAWPLAARAQQRLPVIGFLHIASPGAYVHVIAGFRRGLAESDFAEGRNITVEYRWGEGELDRMPSLLADLLRNQVSVIVGSLQGAQAAKSAGVTISVVFSTSDDPVKHGFVETLNRPGGNMTGVYLFTAELEGKRLGLLHDLLPKANGGASRCEPSRCGCPVARGAGCGGPPRRATRRPACQFGSGFRSCICDPDEAES